MILAKKSGWMILVKLIRKTRSGSYVKDVDQVKPIYVSNKDKSSLLCNSTAEAEKFISEKVNP